jgi:RNA-directed DNA polymerase
LENFVEKRTLEQAFNAVFHGKESFSDFYSLDQEREVISFSVNSRDLLRPSPKLKRYLRFIDKVILRYLARDELVAHSYIKGKSALTAVKVHAGNSHFFMTDIKAFFSKISEEDVRKILSSNESLLPISNIGKYHHKLAKMMTWQGALPVGFPTSPQLSNAFLFDFDRALHSYCNEQTFTYTRYSDDIIISGRSFDGFENKRTPITYSLVSKLVFLDHLLLVIGQKVKRDTKKEIVWPSVEFEERKPKTSEAQVCLYPSK